MIAKGKRDGATAMALGRRYTAVLALWLLASGAAHALDFNGWWWNPAQSGQGINVGQQGDVMFIAWFTYDETGKGAWLVMGGPLSTPAQLTGNFLRTRGPALGTPYDPAKVTAAQVGTGTLTFTDLHHASLAWTFNGKSGTLPLVRETYGTTSIAASFAATGGAASKTSGNAACAYTGSTAAVLSSFGVTTDGITLTLDQSSPTVAHFQAAYEQSGEWLHVQSGNYTSSDAYGGGSFTASVLVIGRTVLAELELQPTAHPGCVLNRTFTGVH